jgi:DinB family protein
MDTPQYPAGPPVPEDYYAPSRRAELIAVLEGAPATMRRAIAGLSEEQLDTRYRNWTIRQIVHHVADSHANAYVRFKLALTEERPTIKPYHEDRWVALADSRTGDIVAPLALLDGLHLAWVQLLRVLSEEEFSRTYFHPETGKVVSLHAALGSYAWHCGHHIGQIAWLREQNGW